MRNSLLKKMAIILTIILLVGVIAYVLLNKLNHSSGNKTPSIDEIVKYSIDVPELTTNLMNGSYIRISFKLETNSSSARDELNKRLFQVNDMIIDQLSQMTSNELEQKNGKDKLKLALMQRINQVMQSGKVVNVYITSYMIQ
ncbi:flagellar basal body-associated protein FliL [Heyndrickxia acidicola]|uniref:Flagellar protein FliL n=1 Tax=Heyndrickxia acidicola TaxID=209389 RepID=A0ABU6MBP5_9BACI|nr:flagellar basal body-associated protein FliL [Heyndrickxia acidicola]MED1202066.1 flagellar basal body-associated protein FliL [Heyndrickxia acidicola]